MTRTIAYCALIVSFGLVCGVALLRPEILDDTNSFLKQFISNQILEIMAVIVSITLTSTSMLHLELNKIEEQYQKEGFQKTRAGIRQAAYGLIVILIATLAIVVVKSSITSPNELQAFLNGLGLFFLFWDFLILLSITQAVFAIKPRLPEA